MADLDEKVLYVSPDTLSRLISSERARISAVGGLSTTIFSSNDHRYPGIVILPSREVIGNAVHRKFWDARTERFVFEYVGDV